MTAETKELEEQPKKQETTYPLSVHDRLVLLNTLPKEGDIITIRILKELKQVVGLTEEEAERAKVKIEGSQIQWDPKENFTAEIPIGKVAKAIIRQTLEELNNAKPKGKLTEDHLPLWDMFC